MFTKIRKQESGFTIVELLIVIVVIGILAALVLNTFQGVQARARDTERTTDINALHTHLEVYFNDRGHYPDGVAGTGCEDGDDTANDDSCVLSLALFAGLDGEALTDPNGNVITLTAAPANGGYGYDVSGAVCVGGQCDSYVLLADLEQGTPNPYVKNSLN